MSVTQNVDRITIALQSFDDIAQTAMQLDGAKLCPIDIQYEADSLGAFVPLQVSGDQGGFHLGIRAHEATCQMLACALMMLPEPEELPEEDLADALGEVANLIAGGFKARAEKYGVDAKLGTPVVIRGDLLKTSGQSVHTADCLLNGENVELIVIENCAELGA